MANEQDIAKWIRYSIPNLRYRWPSELSKFSDRAVALAYDDFYFSDIAGNNDERFPEMFEKLHEYENESDKKL